MSTKKEDPRVIRTKKMFEHALLDLMVEKEYQKITVQEIATKSGLNRATFYLHYYDKDDLLEQFLDNSLNDLRYSVKLIDAEFRYASDYPHPIFVRLFEKMQENSKFYKVILADERISYFTEAVTDIIEETVRDAIRYMTNDQIEYKVPVEIFIPYVTSAYLGVMIWWLKSDMPYTPRYMATQITTMSTVGPFVDNPYLNK